MEIAIMVNVSRETVTRVFQHLQKLQIVSRDGPTKLIINDLQTLKGVAEGNQQLWLIPENGLSLKISNTIKENFSSSTKKYAGNSHFLL